MTRLFNINGSYRMKQTIKVSPFSHIDYDGIVTSYSPSVGQTVSFDKSSSLDAQNHITAAAHADTVRYGDLKYDWAYAPTSNMTTSTNRISNVKCEYFINGSGDNPLVNPSPNIDYNVKVTLDWTNSTSPKVSVSGSHDGYPGYEVYLGTQRIYEFNPNLAGTTPWALLGDGVGDEGISTAPINVDHTKQ